MADRTVIVGSGHAGTQVAASLRESGYGGEILLVSDEMQQPYHRPPLSKTLGKSSSLRALPLRHADFYRANRIELLLGRRVSEIDASSKIVTLDGGRILRFNSLVLATGSRPRLPEISGLELVGVHTLRSHLDAEKLSERIRHARRPVVVGAGLIGLEFAALAAQAGKPIRVIEAGERVLERIASIEMASYLRSVHESAGVTFYMQQRVRRLSGRGSVEAVETSAGLQLDADLVLLAVGAVPNTELAEAAGLEVKNGIVVDQHLRTSKEGIFAVGDCAVFPVDERGARVRLECVQNATDQAKCVARNISGISEVYRKVPWFWSDQYDTKLQIAGGVLMHDNVMLAGNPEQGRFAVYRFRGEELVGVETINHPREHIAARRYLENDPQRPSSPIVTPDFCMSQAHRNGDLNTRIQQPLLRSKTL